VQDIAGEDLAFLRTDEPCGFRFRSRCVVAERVATLPPAASLALDAASFAAGADASAFTDLGSGAAASPATALRLLAGDDGVIIAARCEEPRPSAMRRLVPAGHPTGELAVHANLMGYSAEKDDHLVIAIDGPREHGFFHEFIVTATGFVRARRRRRDHANTDGIHPRTTCDEPLDVAWQHAVAIGDAHWSAALRLPWAALGLDGPPSPAVVGLNVLRLRTVDEARWSAWRRVAYAHALTAADLGDLFLGEPPAEPVVVDLGRPVFGENRMRVTVRGRSAADITVAATVRAASPLPDARPIGGEASAWAGRMLGSASVTVTVVPGSEREATLPFAFDWRLPVPHVLEVELRDRGGAAFHRQRFACDREDQVCVDDRHDWPAPPPDPTRDDPDFVARKRDRLLALLGRFSRWTTLDGAPSDFSVVSADRRTRFDLMRPDACRRIAAFIEDRFATDPDRLAAACLLVHQRAFVTHCLELAAVHPGASPATAMRLGGGHCYARATALAGVVAAMRSTDGSAFNARIAFVLGHVIVAVGGDDPWLFDPSFGSFFYRHDNRGLATRAQIAADLTLADRFIPERRFNFSRPDTHVLAPVGNVRWPSAAAPRSAGDAS